MADLPRAGQAAIPISEWRRFVRVADWWDRTHGQLTGVTPEPATGHIIVKTPAGGIAARTAGPPALIASALCDRYFEVPDSAGYKVLKAATYGGSAQQIRVYNLSSTAVGASKYVTAAKTANGTWYVVMESC